MNKTLTTSLAVLAVAGMVGGGTFAKWSDFQVLTGNESGAGQLTMALNSGGGGTPVPFSNVTLAPGEQNESIIYLSTTQLDYDDAGDQTASVFIQLKDLVGVEDGCTSNSETAEDADCVGPNEGEFKDQARAWIQYKVLAPGVTTCPGHDGSWSSLPGGTPWLGSLQAIETNGRYDVTDVVDNQGVCFHVNIEMPNVAGFDNTAQGDSAGFDLEFVAEQNV